MVQVYAGKSVKWQAVYKYLHYYILVHIYLLLSLYLNVTQWLRHYATNRQVAGSILDGVTGIFQ